MGWQEGGTRAIGIGRKIVKVPMCSGQNENRNFPFLKVCPRAEVTVEIKVKGTYITNYSTYKDTWGFSRFEQGRGVIHPAVVPYVLLPGHIWCGNTLPNHEIQFLCST